MRRRRFLQAAAATLVAGRAAHAAGRATHAAGATPARAARPGEIPRRVLALYKSKETYATLDGARPKSSTLNEAHQAAQMPLNWLGLMVDYHDVDASLPGPEAMAAYRGVLTWFTSEDMDDPRAYLRWLAGQVTAGRRVVIMEALGAFRDRRRGVDLDLEEVSSALAPLGLSFRGRWTTDPRLIEIRHRDGVMEFERKFPPGLPGYFQVVATRADSRPHLTLARRDTPDSASHMVVTGPWGGFAGAGYVRYQAAPFSSDAADPNKAIDAPSGVELYGAKWWLDPFAFFGAAFGVEDWPRPDVTTLNGRRVYYSHIDGDGLRNVSEVRAGALSGEVVDDEILARYALPVTVSVVTSEVDPKLLGSARTEKLARRMFARPNVEAGSHSYAHPLNWEKGVTSFALPGYRFSLAQEIDGSVKFIEERLLPPGTRVRVFQWSGSTVVSEEAIAATDRLGIANINGGDTMRDRQWPSYMRVAPLMRQVGTRWQNYTSASNENLYTRLWTGPFWGFRTVLETFANTEAPRRVAPVNVYYHFYAAERRAGLEALRAVHDWAIRQPLAPIFTSEYLAMVDGFRTARLERLATPPRARAAWRVFQHAALRTLRFDGSTAAVDLGRSRAVLGYTHQQGALYVHLDEAPEAVVTLVDAAPPQRYLASASHRVSAWRMEGDALGFRLSGVGAKSAALAGFPPGARVAVRLTDGADARTVTPIASAAGLVTFDAGAAPVVEVRAG